MTVIREKVRREYTRIAPPKDTEWGGGHVGQTGSFLIFSYVVGLNEK